MKDEYIPVVTEVADIRTETPPGDRMIRTLRVQKEGKAPFAHLPGPL